ncbi:hypothetical protein DM51_5097 [Burkholderia mallei]|nr:hypothetical protein DM51_5097 [Burkholderia mallei]
MARFVDETEVAGAQHAVGKRAGPVGVEGRLGRVRPAEIAVAHAVARDADLADRTRRLRLARRRIDDAKRLVRVLERADRHGVDRAAAVLLRLEASGRERRAIRAPNDDALADLFRRRGERELREPVARRERIVAKAGAGERVGEFAQRARPHRLRAIERLLPRRQIEPREVHPARAAPAQLVAEIRRAAAGRAIVGHRVQPARRVLEEVLRRHEHRGPPRVDRLQDSADQPHVVIMRQPRHDQPALAVAAPVPAQQPLVREQVVVADHHALRIGRRARRVLKERDAPGRDGGQRARRVAGVAAVGNRAHFAARRRDDARRAQLGEHGVHLAVAADRERRRAVARDRDQPAALLLGARRQRRHGHPARVQAAEERFDEIGGGREDQQHRVCRAAVRDDLARDPERAAVNVAVAHHAVRHAAEAEVAVCEFVGRRLGAIAQHVGEIGRGRERRRRGERAAGGEGGLDG